MDETGGDGTFLLADDRKAFETKYGDGRPSVAIVRAIAAVEGVSATDVGFSLHEYVDADALDGLFAPSRDDDDADLTVEFPVAGYRVRVEDDGQVLVTPADT